MQNKNPQKIPQISLKTVFKNKNTNPSNSPLRKSSISSKSPTTSPFKKFKQNSPSPKKTSSPLQSQIPIFFQDSIDEENQKPQQYNDLDCSPLSRKNPFQFKNTEQFNFQQDDIKKLYSNLLPYIKDIVKQIDKLYEEDGQFIDFCEQYGVQQEFLKFYFIKYIEYCFQVENINAKTIAFFRVSKQIYKIIITKTEKVLKESDCQNYEQILNIINSNSNLILPQSLIEYLGSNDQIPQLFIEILYNLSSQQDFYLQDFIQQKYPISEGELLNIIKALLRKDNDIAKSLITQIPKLNAFINSEFYISKVIIWQSLNQYNYSPHIINEILETVEYYRYFIWQKKSQLLQEKSQLFQKHFQEQMKLPKLQKEEKKQFSIFLYKYFFLQPNLYKASQLLSQFIEPQNMNFSYLNSQFFSNIQKIWELSQLDPFLLMDFKTKLRKCMYLLQILKRPFDTEKTQQILQESRIQTSKESQQIQSDLINNYFIDILQFIINYFYSSKDVYSVYDILGAITAYNLSKMAGNHIIHVLEKTFKAVNLDSKIKQNCLDLISEEFKQIDIIQQQKQQQQQKNI